MATIEKRGNTFKITVSGGYTVDGKQLRHNMTWKPAPDMTPKQVEKELNKQATLYEERVRSGVYIGGSIRLSEFIERWFSDYGAEHLKATTYKNYKDCMKRILPAIGHIQLNKLQPHHLLEFYANLEEEGIRADTKYKPCNNFADLLKSRKITQVKLQELSGCSIGTIRSCIKGNNVSADTVQAISKALELPAPELFKPCTDGNTLSGATALYYHRVLSSILSTAVYWQIIPSNPCNRVKPPKYKHKEAAYLNEQEALHLLECLDNEPILYKTMFTLILYSGMRRGEVCGLTWNDVDLNNSIADINKSSLYLSDKGIFDDDTKNKSSRRVIKIPTQATELLKEYKAVQTAERLKLGDKWNDSGKIFTSWDGHPIHPDTVSGWFHDFVKRHNLPHITVHSLRHTNATLLIANGTDIKTVSKRLGHSNVTTTGNIYTHAIKTADEMASDTLQDLFNVSKRSKEHA